MANRITILKWKDGEGNLQYGAKYFEDRFSDSSMQKDASSTVIAEYECSGSEKLNQAETLCRYASAIKNKARAITESELEAELNQLFDKK